MDNVLSSARVLVTPKDSEIKKRDRLANTVMSLVEQAVEGVEGIIGVDFGGSYAKGTWLADPGEDIDIFIKFKEEVSLNRFEDTAKRIGFLALEDYKPYVKYSDHPYVEGEIDSTRINLVPMYAVEIGKWRSIADRSQFHTEIMQKSLTKKMQTEVRLLKMFLKCGHVYGAEIAVRGFSGYLAEVLICEYGSFYNVVKAIAKIRFGQVIGKASKKFDTSITITDPVDPNRNLMAAVSNENLGRFILTCREYCKKPSLRFFKKKRILPNKTVLKNTIIINFNVKVRSPDTLWGQLKRSSAMITKQLECEGFSVIRHGAGTDENSKAALIFLLESTTISEYRVNRGPEFFADEATKRFVEKNSKIAEMMWINGNRICALEKRRYHKAQDVLFYIITGGLQKSGISKGLQDDIKNAKISTGKLPINEPIKKAAIELLSTNATVSSSN